MVDGPLPAVSDSGPLIHLAQVEQIHLLKTIFVEVAICPEVKREVVDEGLRLGHPDAKLVANALGDGYIVVHELTRRDLRRASTLSKEERLSESDSETLILAQSLRRPLLTDERILSKLGKMYDLEVWDTWTVLLEALRRKIIGRQQIQAAIDELEEKRHKLRPTKTKEILDAADKILSEQSSPDSESD